MALANKLCEEFQRMELNVITPRVKPMLCAIETQPTLMEEIRVEQAMNPQLEWIREEVLSGKAQNL